MRASLIIVLVLAFASLLSATPKNEFFALDTIARGGRASVPAMLKELGYAGYGGRALETVMIEAIPAAELKYYTAYLVLELKAGGTPLEEKLRTWLDAVRGQNFTLWLALSKVTRADGSLVPFSSPEGDEIAAPQLQALAAYAAERGVRLSLYHHSRYWLERFEDATRLAAKIDRPTVKVTFNLCHWLKLEGDQRAIAPVLKAALPQLDLVTISGADRGDTREMTWTKLIQPLDSGSYDLAAFVRTLSEVGYTGPVGFQGYGIKEEPRDVLARSIAAWRKFGAAR